MAAVVTILQQIHVVHDFRIRRREGLHDRKRPAGGAARCIQREFGGGAQPLDARAILAPLGKALRPLRRFGRGERFRSLAGSTRFIGVDPWRKVAGREPRERQQQISEIAFRIDRDDGNAVDRRLLDHVDAETGLAAAGHAGNHSMRDESGRIVKKGSVATRLGVGIDFTSEIEEPQLLEIFH